jgi:uncharacterized protein (TIGR01319 family)
VTTYAVCADVGSTFTKVAVVDLADGALIATASHPTTVGTDVLHGLDAAVAAATAAGLPTDLPWYVCSSAGGGLRLAVVGNEELVTARAGRAVGLSAGARVVHVAAGRLDGDGLAALRAARPDVLLLVGGTDGGDAEVLLHNATRLARARWRQPVVLAGNADARPEAGDVLAGRGVSVTAADNVLPRIGVLRPEAARAAIRKVFLRHVIGGKHLSRGPRFEALVRAATPDAVLTGVELLADQVGGDLAVVDVGGATTDVYSVVTPDDQDASMRTDVAGTLWHARTVEGDLGVRWNAVEVVEAAARERVPVAAGLHRYATAVAANPAHLPADDEEVALDLQLATIAALVAVRRHARPSTPGQSPRPLGDVGVVLGSGGVLRHATAEQGMRVLAAVTGDHAGGWRVPRSARTGVDVAYLLSAVGLLADEHPDIARVVATGLARSHMLGGPE